MDTTGQTGERTELHAVGSRRKARRPRGLTVERFFTRPGEDPFDAVEWELRTAKISNEKGDIVFEQTGVEVPKSWSQLATNVVVSKYFRGHLGTPGRERSVRQLIGRVVDTMTEWGRRGRYFASEELVRSASRSVSSHRR